MVILILSGRLEMSKIYEYREKLKVMNAIDYVPYLMQESNLPGPRGNLELGYAVSIEGSEELFKELIQFTPDKAPVNSPYEFLTFCGVVGLGRLVSEGKSSYMPILKTFASDPRWRIREGVAMALQLLGERDMGFLIYEMNNWITGNPLEQRAAAAALCEPKLLKVKEHVEAVLYVLDNITSLISKIKDRKSSEFDALRKGLGYCWSVAIAAYPEKGKDIIEKWFYSSDKDIIWIMKENLKKNRLIKMDSPWVEEKKSNLGCK
jgi:hypothetical protein